MKVFILNLNKLPKNIIKVFSKYIILGDCGENDFENEEINEMKGDTNFKFGPFLNGNDKENNNSNSVINKIGGKEKINFNKLSDNEEYSKAEVFTLKNDGDCQKINYFNNNVQKLNKLSKFSSNQIKNKEEILKNNNDNKVIKVTKISFNNKQSSFESNFSNINIDEKKNLLSISRDSPKEIINKCDLNQNETHPINDIKNTKKQKDNFNKNDDSSVFKCREKNLQSFGYTISENIEKSILKCNNEKTTSKQIESSLRENNESKFKNSKINNVQDNTQVYTNSHLNNFPSRDVFNQNILINENNQFLLYNSKTSSISDESKHNNSPSIHSENKFNLNSNDIYCNEQVLNNLSTPGKNSFNLINYYQFLDIENLLSNNQILSNDLNESFKINAKTHNKSPYTIDDNSRIANNCCKFRNDLHQNEDIIERKKNCGFQNNSTLDNCEINFNEKYINKDTERTLIFNKFNSNMITQEKFNQFSMLNKINMENDNKCFIKYNNNEYFNDNKTLYSSKNTCSSQNFSRQSEISNEFNHSLNKNSNIIDKNFDNQNIKFLNNHHFNSRTFNNFTNAHDNTFKLNKNSNANDAIQQNLIYNQVFNNQINKNLINELSLKNQQMLNNSISNKIMNQFYYFNNLNNILQLSNNFNHNLSTSLNENTKIINNLMNMIHYLKHSSNMNIGLNENQTSNQNYYNNLNTNINSVNNSKFFNEINELLIKELENILMLIDKIDESVFNKIKNNFIILLKSQNGSRVLQKYLKNTHPLMIKKIFYHLNPLLPELLMDPYANYFCQKFFIYLEKENRLDFLKRVFYNLMIIIYN